MKQKRSASRSASTGHSSPLSILAAVAAVLLSPSAARAAARPVKIGIVDTRVVLDKLLRWQHVQGELRAAREKAEGHWAADQKEIARLRAEMLYFKPESRDYRQRQGRIAEKQETLLRSRRRLSRALAERSGTALEAVRKELRQTVKSYAAANGFDVVVDAGAVLYVAGGVDISLKVAFEMNRRYKDEQAKRRPNGPKGD